MMKVVLMAVLLVCCVKGFAADTIIVHKDSRLDLLAAKQAEINKTAVRLTPNGQYKGYRLLIITTHSRDEAYKAKAGVLQYFPDSKTYVSYLSPYFRVKVGNYNNREDAEAFKAKLEKVYNGGVYVVEDLIEYEAPAQDTTHLSNQ